MTENSFVGAQTDAYDFGSLVRLRAARRVLILIGHS